MRHSFLLVLLWSALTAGVASGFSVSDFKPVKVPEVAASELPPEAHTTLKLIDQSTTFPYRQDGMTFGNRENLLPKRARGFYREYTVVTPGSRSRGARRIVTGDKPPKLFYYTDDHYRSFRLIQR